jgi:hypothetical protein
VVDAVTTSIGVDCSGYQQSTINYVGEKYIIGSQSNDVSLKGDVTWDDWVGGQLIGASGFANQGYLIYSDRDEEGQGGDEGGYTIERTFPAIIVPGDIITLNDNNDGVFEHTATVMSVNDADGDGFITRDEVVLLEAASGIDKQYHILNTQTWWMYRDYENMPLWDYFIRRLEQRIR